MDTRVLLANANKRYEAIFNALQVLNGSITQEIGVTSEVIYTKLVEVDNKIDLVLAHLGIEVPTVQEPELEKAVVVEPLPRNSDGSIKPL